MPKSKLMQLLVKYADEKGTALPPGNIHPVSQKAEKDEDFYYDLQMMLRATINELEGDVSILKSRKFDPEMHKLLVSVWRRLEDFYKMLKPSDPWRAAREALSYLENRHNKSVIENLDFLATHHVSKTNVDFTPNKFMVNPEVRSLKLLHKLEQFLKEKIQESTPAASLQSTVRPPSKMNMPAVRIPILPPINVETPFPSTAPESPESKKRMKEEEVG